MGRRWIALLFAAPGAACATGTPAKPVPLALGSAEAVRAAMQLDSDLEDQRDALATQVAEAHRIMSSFALAHGWEKQAAKVEIARVEVVEDGEALWERYVELCKVPGNVPAPRTKPEAAPACGTLLAVSPAAYAKAKPAYASAQPDAWARLLAHELVHLLHIQVLRGDEEAMGPQWFFEGLAVVGSGQAFGTEIAYDSGAHAIAATRSVAPGAYGRYAAALRYFLAKVDLSEMVARASAPDFEHWLTER